MHTEVSDYVAAVKHKHPSFFYGRRVLEVGSLDINGSVRDFFTGGMYVGIDLGEGPGVDRVARVHELGETARYDMVISTGMLEHDKHWKLSLAAMYRALAPRGMLLLTCAGPDFPEHGTTAANPGDAPFTNDWYRNISVEDFQEVLGRQLFKSYNLSYGLQGRRDLLFHGIKIS